MNFDFLFLNCLGGIAQLVERLLCKQDVSGSSPLISTKSKEKGISSAPNIKVRMLGLNPVKNQNLDNCIIHTKVTIAGS